MSRLRLCRGLPGDPCAEQTLDTSGLCDRHGRGFRRAVRNRAYDTPAWRRHSARVLADWRARHGDWCPGYPPRGHAPHRTADLVVDHTTPMSHGGALLGPTSVMCRSANAMKRWDDTPTRRGDGSKTGR